MRLLSDGKGLIVPVTIVNLFQKEGCVCVCGGGVCVRACMPWFFLQMRQKSLRIIEILWHQDTSK